MTDTTLAAPATARAPDVRMAYWWATPGERRPAPAHPMYHPLFALLDAVRCGGSIKAAAGALGLSYRHVWGELRRWESELGRGLLHIERSTQDRFAPQLEAMRRELEHALIAAYDG
jgi:putative molybdopterin biosynthesis protein